jgi:predicted 3-demethylubiquinone-9 3-methyltransferase (glyoxalase superfamily)
MQYEIDDIIRLAKLVFDWNDRDGDRIKIDGQMVIFEYNETESFTYKCKNKTELEIIEKILDTIS